MKARCPERIKIYVHGFELEGHEEEKREDGLRDSQIAKFGQRVQPKLGPIDIIPL